MLLHYMKGNEEESFYCLVHVMEFHDWRGCFDNETTKLIGFIDFLDAVL